MPSQLLSNRYPKPLFVKLLSCGLPLGLGLGLIAMTMFSLSSIQAVSPAMALEMEPDRPPSSIRSLQVAAQNSLSVPYLVKDINPNAADSSPSELTAVGNLLFFTADNGTSGVEIWKSDGTPTGTVMVKDIYVGAVSSGASKLAAVSNTLFFRANDSSNGSELWKSDGTSIGTVMVKDIKYGWDGSSPLNLTAMSDTLFFQANDGSYGYELWKSDGTPTDTIMVKDIYTGLFSSSPNWLTVMGGILYFRATDGDHGNELWKSDGTPTGTIMVKDIHSGTSSSTPRYLAAVDDTLYFQANDGSNGVELWKSDGTPTGTVMVKDIYTGTTGSSPSQMTNMNGTCFFQATDGVSGLELWKSDGTPTGTVMVKDINPGIPDASPYELTVVSGTLLFRAADGWTGTAHGGELWKSDGTSTGTVMVTDINPTAFVYPYKLAEVNGTLYFQANNGIYGYEPWQSDGTPTGTVMIEDIYTGTNGSSPQEFTGVDEAIFFYATDNSHGKELWVMGLEPEVIEEPVSGLTATSDSPTPLGQATNFTASVAGGTDVVYAWGFGDGSTAHTGSTEYVSHVYPSTGNYVAIITASNIINAITTTTRVTTTNQPPYRPSNPTPPNGATGVPLTQTFSWEGGDPDGHSVTYDVAFSTSDPPPVITTTTLTSYTPALTPDTTYYWDITASDGISTSVGPTWSLTTFKCIYLPLVLQQ